MCSDKSTIFCHLLFQTNSLKRFDGHIFILLFLLSIYSNAHAWTENLTSKKHLSENLDTVLVKKVLYPYYELTFINDLNPALGLISNDEGYTLGIYHQLRIIHKKKERFYDIAIASDLYTDYHYPEGYSDNGKWIVPQTFTEINCVSFSVSQYIKSKKIFAGLEFGTGVRNKDRAIPGFALYFQGGENGRGGYHSLLSMHANQNVSTGQITPFVYLAPSIRKLFIFNPNRANHDPFYIDILTGFSLGSSQIKSSAFFKMNSELPILQAVNSKKNIFKLSSIFKSLVLVHPSGLQFNPELGLEFQIFFVSLGYNSIFYFGKQNAEVIDFYDNEPCMRAYVKVHF